MTLAMKLRWIDSTGVSNRDLAELPTLRQRTDGFLWLDIPNGVTRRRHRSQTSFTFIRWRSAKVGTVITFPEFMSIRTRVHRRARA